MTRVYTNALDRSGHGSSADFQNTPVGSPTITHTAGRVVGKCLQIAYTSGTYRGGYSAYYPGTSTNGQWIYFRKWFWFDVLPSGDLNLFDCNYSTVHDYVALTSTGALKYVATGQTSSTLATSTWHCLEYAIQMSSSASSSKGRARVNGSDFGNVDTVNITAGSNKPVFNFGEFLSDPGKNITLKIDDVGMNDDSGATNNSWLGMDGQSVTLYPVSDYSRGSGWTTGSGGTTDLWQAVNNDPPIGVALASRTNTSQIYNSGVNTDTVEFTTETYTAAGLGVSDTVVAVHADFIVSAAAYMTVSLTDNPVAAGSSKRGGISGAGTYPSGWYYQGYNYQPAFLFSVDYPTISKGSGSRISISKDNSAYTADVCLVALNVEYITAAAEPEPTPVLLIGTGL